MNNRSQNLSKLQIFWLGINAARKELGLPELMYGEARALYQEAMERADAPVTPFQAEVARQAERVTQ